MRAIRSSLVKGTDQPYFGFAPAQYRSGIEAVIPADPAVHHITLDEHGKALVHLCNGRVIQQGAMAGVWTVRR